MKSRPSDKHHHTLCCVDCWRVSRFLNTAEPTSVVNSASLPGSNRCSSPTRFWPSGYWLLLAERQREGGRLATPQAFRTPSSRWGFFFFFSHLSVSGGGRSGSTGADCWPRSWAACGRGRQHSTSRALETSVSLRGEAAFCLV